MSERKIISRRDALKNAGLVLGALLLNCGKQFDNTESPLADSENAPISLQIKSPVELELLGLEERKIVERLWSMKDYEVPEWRVLDRPTFINIKSIRFGAEPQLVEEIGGSDGSITFSSPDSGIATPQRPLFPMIYVFGHSRWRRVPQEFGKIEQLQRGDLIEVLNDERIKFHFLVTEFVLNRGEDFPIQQDLTLMLQTTAVTGGEWILNREEISRKTKDGEEVYNGANLMVIAKPIRARVQESS